MTLSVNCIFSSIPKFVHYFKEHDELTIPPNQSFEIHQLSPIHDPLIANEHPLSSSEPFFPRMLWTLNRLVSCLGKKIILENDYFKFPESYFCHIDDNKLHLASLFPITLKLQLGPIHTSISDLFRLMVLCDIPKFVLEKNQSLIIENISDDSTELDTIKDISREAFIQGFSSLLQKKNYTGNLLSLLTTSDADHTITKKPPDHLVYTSTSPLTLELHSLFQFKSLHFFRQMLILKKSIKINTLREGSEEYQLKIKSSQLSGIVADYLKNMKENPTKKEIFDYLLSYISLPFEEDIAIIHSEPMTYQLTKDSFVLCSKKPFSIELEQTLKDKVCFMKSLIQSLIEEKKTRLMIEPNRKLIFSYFQKECFKSCPNNKIKYKVIEQLFANIHPIYRAQLGISSQYQIETRECKNPKFVSFIFSSKGPMEFFINRIYEDLFIENIINKSSPRFEEELLDCDTSSYYYLAFRVILRMVIGQPQILRDPKIANFFQAKTLESMERLKTHEDFKNNVNKVIGNNEYRSKLLALEMLSANAFDELDLKELPEPIRYIILEIKKIAAEEIQGSTPLFSKGLEPVLSKKIAELKNQEKKATSSTDEEHIEPTSQELK